MHMQEDKFSSQPLRSKGPAPCAESPELRGGCSAGAADWRAAEPLAGRAPRPGIASTRIFHQASAAAAAEEASSSEDSPSSRNPFPCWNIKLPLLQLNKLPRVGMRNPPQTRARSSGRPRPRELTLKLAPSPGREGWEWAGAAGWPFVAQALGFVPSAWAYGPHHPVFVTLAGLH